MIIEDEELRGIYQTASEERLQALDAGLLALEQRPDDRTILDGLMREAHSLKGDSNMLGLSHIGQGAHHLETILGRVKRGEQAFSADLGDRLARGLEVMRQMVQAAVTGRPWAGTAAAAIAAMEGTTVPSPASAPLSGEGDLAEMPVPERASAPGTPSVPWSVAVQPQIAQLATGLQQLIERGGDRALLPDLIAVAQALATTASAGNQPDFTTLTRQVAWLLTALHQGEEGWTAALGDRLTHGVAVLEALAKGTGDRPSVNAFYALAELMGAPASAAAVSGDCPPVPEPAAVSPTATMNGTAAARLQTTAKAAAYRIETIRVPTHSLDALMNQTGELTVTKIRVAHRLGEIDAIANLWEDWSRDLFKHRFLCHEVQQGQKSVRQLESLHNRTEQYLEQLGTLVNRLRSALYEDTTRLDLISNDLEEGVRTLRLLPLSTIFNLLPRLVRDLARQEGKAVKLVIEGAETRADKRILEEMKDPLLHMIRNAIDHGIESPEERVRQGKPEIATITLRGYQTPTSIVLEVSDDGRGLNVEAIQQTAIKRNLCRPEDLATMTPEHIQNLILSPGFSTRTLVTEISGRGVGLDVLRTNVERLNGSIEVRSTPGQGCTLRVQLGTTLATAHVLIVAVGDNTYAIPVEFVQTAYLVHPDGIFTVEGRSAVVHDGQPISVARLGDLLELPPAAPATKPGNQSQQLSCIVLQSGGDRLGIFVDALLDEQDVVLKPQSQLLKRVRNIAGATILGTGEVCMVLNPHDLMQSVRRWGLRLETSDRPAIPTPDAQRPLSILLVEDSIATRTQEKRILEAAGYEVVTAVDGLDGFTKLQSRPFDAVVSDVQMPNLDGLGLTRRLRQQREYKDIPVVLVTTLASDDDRQRGAEAGANAYITKGSFNQEVLLETLQRLI